MGDGGARRAARRSSTSTRGSPAPARWRTRTSRSAPAPTSRSSAASSTTSWSNELDFREYVVAYTNAATIVSEDFQDTEDLDGLFSGFDPETAHLRPGELAVRRRGRPGRAEHGAGRRAEDDARRSARPAARPAARVRTARRCSGEPERDETLQHPRCVYQILKRHFARYTPEMVEQVCGDPPEQFLEVCEAWTANSGRERTTALVYSRRLDPAHRRRAVHPHRRDHPAAAGQHGPPRRRHHGAARPRQHPGLDRHPDAVQPAARLPADAAPPTSTTTLRRVGRRASATPGRRASGPTPSAYAVSLLKAYWGDAATADNDFCFDYLPRLTGDHGTYRTVLDMIDGKVKGYFLLGQNPAVGSAHGKAQRLGMANLDWLVVRDLCDDRERHVLEGLARRSRPARSCRRSAAPRCSSCRRRPTWRRRARSPRPSGCCSGARRRSSRRATAARELWFFYHLGRMVRERLAGSTDERDRPLLDLTWDYPVARRARRRAQRRGGAARRSTATRSRPAGRCRRSPR